MTIALGILTNDGVVLAADTEETMLGGTWKSDHGKITAVTAKAGNGRNSCQFSVVSCQ